MNSIHYLILLNLFFTGMIHSAQMPPEKKIKTEMKASATISAPSLKFVSARKVLAIMKGSSSEEREALINQLPVDLKRYTLEVLKLYAGLIANNQKLYNLQFSLGIAIKNNLTELIGDLIAMGVDLNKPIPLAVDSPLGGEIPNLSPLGCAVCCADPDMITLLWNSGAKEHYDFEDGDLNLPIHLAAMHAAFDGGDFPGILEVLLQLGFSLESKTRDGRTPLFCAITYGTPEQAKFLLDLGVNINAQNNVGNTILMEVISRLGHWTEEEMIESITFLLDNGADITIRNAEGENALDIAISMDYQEVQEVLETYMPKQN